MPIKSISVVVAGLILGVAGGLADETILISEADSAEQALARMSGHEGVAWKSGSLRAEAPSAWAEWRVEALQPLKQARLYIRSVDSDAAGSVLDLAVTTDPKQGWAKIATIDNNKRAEQVCELNTGFQGKPTLYFRLMFPPQTYQDIRVLALEFSGAANRVWNPGFERKTPSPDDQLGGHGNFSAVSPDHWRLYGMGGRTYTMIVTGEIAEGGHTGERCVALTQQLNSEGQYPHYAQVLWITPATRYHLEGYLKATKPCPGYIAVALESGLILAKTPDVDSSSWKKYETDFVTGADVKRVVVKCVVADVLDGTVWFDDLSVVPVP